MRRSFDNLAQPYQKLEYWVFGDLIERVRAHHLPRINSRARSALLLGDGDGRFAQALLMHCPHIQIDSIDLSPRMLEIAKRRNSGSGRFTAIQADATDYSYPTNKYDFIALNFIVDCFSQAEFDSLKPKLHASQKPNGQLLYSDFSYSGKPFSKLFIQLLYLAFKATTDISGTNAAIDSMGNSL